MAIALLDEIPAHMLAPIAERIDRDAATNDRGQIPSDAIAGFFGGYRFLSNFWLSPVEMYGDTYPSVEHAYQAAKSCNPEDHRTLRAAPSPAAAKRLGQSLDLRPDWVSVRVHFMLVLVRRKFQHPALAERLLATGSAAIFEDTTRWNDRVWGVVRQGQDYSGGNRLGRILENIRAELMALNRPNE